MSERQGGNIKQKGLIIVNTGDGKGKTTAALGMAFRAIGHDYNIVMIQFKRTKKPLFIQ